MIPEKQGSKIRTKKKRPKKEARGLVVAVAVQIKFLITLLSNSLNISNEEQTQGPAQDVNPRLAVLWHCYMMPSQKDSPSAGHDTFPQSQRLHCQGHAVQEFRAVHLRFSASTYQLCDSEQLILFLQASIRLSVKQECVSYPLLCNKLPHN